VREETGVCYNPRRRREFGDEKVRKEKVPCKNVKVTSKTKVRKKVVYMTLSTVSDTGRR
jgi:hypothetical protein